MAPLGITGNVRNRFIEAAVLLHMLDPVRGEPTAHGLDQDPHEIETPRERLLKRKFLDSFALVCATRKDGDSVSAACMEEGMPQGTVVRIASNSGVRESTLSQVRELVGILNSIASGGALSFALLHVSELVKLIPFFTVFDASGKETEILVRVIRLDIAKIRHYLENLRAAKGVFEEPISAVELRLAESSTLTSHTTHSALQQFLEWFRHIFAIRDLASDSEPEVLIHHIRWAQEAKRQYLEFLKAAFSTKTQHLPRWISMILKLGRYGVASRALVQLASDFPALFNPMIVEPVTAPLNTRFTISGDKMPLTSVLRRVVGSREEEYLSRLARVWNTADPEMHFRRACSLNLVVHAEMQLVSFYDHNRQCKPSLRFIGVSKKSCYLCHMFLVTHPEAFGVSSCHQKLYVSWIPPPAADPSVYRRYKAITTELSKVMEATAKQDLEDRLGSQRKYFPADSTAGVSLSGLTESGPAGVGTQVPVGSGSGFAVNQNATAGRRITMEEGITGPESSFHPIEVVNLTPSNEEMEAVTFNETFTAMPPERYLGNSDPTPISAMVFHLMRADDASRQDIVSMGDVLDSSTNCPSWAKLVEILKADDDFGLAFNEGREFLMVNNRVRVSNERQFLACLQYLRNSKMLNSDASVCSCEMAHSTTN